MLSVLTHIVNLQKGDSVFQGNLTMDPLFLQKLKGESSKENRLEMPQQRNGPSSLAMDGE